MHTVIKCTSQDITDDARLIFHDIALTESLHILSDNCSMPAGGISGLLQCSNPQRHFSSTFQSPCTGVGKAGFLQGFSSIMWSLTFDFMLTLTSSTCLELEKQGCTT